MIDQDKCCFPGCRQQRNTLFINRPLCWAHWDLVANEDDKIANKAMDKIGLKRNESGKVVEK